ncbi:hypothetical protein PTSG_09649 [Salpingoeca rosetta]|uniref:beta-N-acetylhexosaminidase n=1 Tax=Salpingoeca rosetta (strain ATCC 50818 / BSB-021) TaxID=946362 RepID=F2ULL2_SALR5|nr:uncharacterized protein PTSG_09649 [Salpingoeca rosetta]EGD78011.1 hypothetical protein PTSG_09649 [Salpingoeca rosetta]|eukprot:XP_004990073.1 hypothetical protein PTSG_09649 [Salpingoeca rosetta]
MHTKSATAVAAFVHRHRGDLEPHMKAGWPDTLDASAASPSKNGSRAVPYLTTVSISVLDDTETLKHVASNESYFLNVTSPTTHITAQTIWGAMYALETLSQVIMFNDVTSAHTISHAPLEIWDEPSYPMRGIMVDSANHFIGVPAIKRLLDGMVAVKMNTLHWHLVDSYSFPMQVPSRPMLSRRGAWSNTTVYTRADMRAVQEYAQQRGIRVIPEIDVPGHAYSWGLAYPDITVECPKIHTTDIGPINVVPLDPTKELTYQVLEDVLAETTSLFPDAMLHVGGDEVQYECWRANQDIQDWMKKNNISSEQQLEVYFEQRLFAMLRTHNRRAVVWDEAFTDMHDHLDTSVVVEVWDDPTLLERALRAGHDVLFASGWYLDRQVPYGNMTHWFWLDTWADMYAVAFPRAPAGGGRILGGEAPMWSEQVSDLSIDARVWPRALAAAERLWNQNATDHFDAAQRIGVHRCRMAARGIPVGPIWADYCSHDAQDVNIHQLSSSHHHSVNMTVGEMSALLVFIFLLGVAVVWVFAACFGVGFRVRGRDDTLNAQSVAAGTAGSVQHAKTNEDEVPLLAVGDTRPASSSFSRASRMAATPPPPPTSSSSAAVAAARSRSNTAASASARGTLDAQPAQRSLPKERLSSLDVFRGFTVALMVFVDETGAAFPPIDHSPWNGVRLADFVMPFFDFIVGVSLALSFKKFDLEDATTTPRVWPALRKATIRFLKLFILGMLTQGGIDIMNYDLAHIRIMGILQRVAVCYYAVALMEIFLPRNKKYRNYNETDTVTGWAVDVLHMLWRYKWHWFTAACLFATHTGIMYGVNVPDAFGEECGRGVLTPACNAATYIDRNVLTVEHMYFPANGGDKSGNDVTFQRLPECSTCSPGKCVPPEDAPAWCLHGPFDPEGLVSSLNAIIATVIGIHYGHVLRRVQSPKARIVHWTAFGVVQLVIGFALHFSGAFVMNTDLYSISYTLVTAGTGGVLLALFYVIVDRLHVGEWAWSGCRYMGMNAIVMYLCAEGDIIPYVLAAFYWNKPENNLANILWPTGVFWGDGDERPFKPTYNYQVMLWTLAYIGVWMLLARYLFLKRIFITI